MCEIPVMMALRFHICWVILCFSHQLNFSFCLWHANKFNLLCVQLSAFQEGIGWKVNCGLHFKCHRLKLKYLFEQFHRNWYPVLTNLTKLALLFMVACCYIVCACDTFLAWSAWDIWSDRCETDECKFTLCELSVMLVILAFTPAWNMWFHIQLLLLSKT
jgi:hypothetical protein